MVTIKDVAKKAGVAISTASYALNNDPRVSERTREKVLSVARELNYYPNAAARNLKRQRTNTIGVFVDGFAGPVYASILDGIHVGLAEKKFNIIVSTGDSGKRILLERQVDGGIVIDQHLSDELLLMVARKGLPLILLDRRLTGKNIHVSTIDNERIVYDFIGEMIKRGYREFAYLSGPKTSYDNLHRYKGYCKALEDHGISQGPIYYGEFTKRGGYRVGTQLIADKVPLPQFIFSANDEMAIGIMDAFQEAGIRIPDDVAIAGFDNIELASYYTPKLTTIDVKRFEWGKSLAQAMVELLTSNKKEIAVKVQCKIIYRESC